jgi:hypothetical protein
MSHGVVFSRDLDGDTVLDEGRVKVGIGQCQDLVSLLNVP